MPTQGFEFGTQHSTAVGQPHLWVEANAAHHRLSPFSGKLGSTLAAFPHRVYRRVFAVVMCWHAMPGRCSRNYATPLWVWDSLGLDNLSRSSTMLKETWRRSPRCWAFAALQTSVYVSHTLSCRLFCIARGCARLCPRCPIDQTHLYRSALESGINWVMCAVFFALFVPSQEKVSWTEHLGT